ncbi:MAG TPA: glycosyl hydrolase family 65 protein [Candidatus Saccharimonadales bacterium]|nr:glycosyl hydrolase family 65 protein [Candidatus Saccharimonadales bacterium]
MTEITTEFFVTDQPGEQPVVNFLANDEYGLLLSDGLGGYSFNAAGDCLTRVGDALIISDRPGRIIYLRDHDTGQWWNVTPNGAPEPSRHYQARHGLGYSIFESECNGIGLAAKVFVPPSDPVELWELKITNLGKIKRRLSLYIVAEWAELFDHCRALGNGLIATSRFQDDLIGLAGFDHSLDSFETDPATFFGRGGGYGAPQALEDGRLSRTQGQLPSNGILVLEKKISLGGRAHFELATILGLVSGPRSSEKAKKLLSHYSDAAKRQAAFETVNRNWQMLLSRQKIKTPDQTLNERYNSLASYQGHLANRWPAVTSYGDRRVFQALTTAEMAEQITLGLLDAPLLVRDRLVQLLERQFKDGAMPDEWTDAASAELSPSSKATIGLLNALASYLNETGDVEFLKIHRPFVDGGSGSTHEHLNRAIKWLTEQLSESHLLATGHESISVTAELLVALEQVIPILESTGDHHQAEQLLELNKKLRSAINHHWAGGSYPRQLSPNRIGSKGQKPRQLDLATQLWAMTGRVADAKRTAVCLNTIKKQLVTRHGVVDFAWPYETVDPSNPLSFDAPGTGRNGAISAKNSLFYGRVLALSGDGDSWPRLLTTVGQWLPETVSLTGQTDVRFGATVALDWQKTILENLAGVTATLGGLKIDPCLPRDWRSLEINRHFRGAEYQIRITNPLRVCRGVERIIVDGSRLTGQVIPPFRAGTHSVEVFLG